MQDNKKILYILKDKQETKQPNWELRNREVRINKYDAKGNLVGVREIQYIPGASSIWKNENKEEGSPKSIWFKDGSISVSASDKTAIKFLESHPDYGIKFTKYDPEAEAAEEFKKFEKSQKATELLGKEAGDDVDKMSAIAATLFGAQSMSWAANKTKMRCFNYAKDKPQEVLDAINDPAAEANYVAAVGFKRKVVATNPQRTAVVWNDEDRGVICRVPSGKKALNMLGEFLLEDANLQTLQRIGDLIDEKTGKKKASKKTSKTSDNKE